MKAEETGSKRLLGGVVLALPILWACAAPSLPPAGTLAPDLGKRVVAENAVVTAANPAASEAGVEMLRRGGNAVDAAVATAFAVSVGEPQMSGLGGGGSMLIWLQAEQRAEYVDFYSAQRPASWVGLRDEDGVRSDLRRVAIPGAVAGLLEAHERFGRLPRADVLAPAIRLAEDGFPVNPILAQMIARDSAKLNRYPESRRVLWPGGRPLRAGDILQQPELAATLRLIADRGSSGFYEGGVARDLVQQLNAGGHPATLADLAEYRPQWKRPMCGVYRGNVVLSASPPQTGFQVLHTLALLEPFDLPSLGLPTRSPRAFDVLTSALRVGLSASGFGEDPHWRDDPAVGVISPAYAEARRPFVGTGTAAARIAPGDPGPHVRSAASAPCEALDPYRHPLPGAEAGWRAPAAEVEVEGGETTHLSVVDAAGNAVALTQTISSTFGIGDRTAAGFMLNDSGIDFTRDAERAAYMESGRHPYWVRKSTIAPTIVLRDGRAVMVVGAPGGGRIPTEVLQNMVYVLDYGMDPMEALRMPRIFPAAARPEVQLEHGFGAELLAGIRAMGYEPTAESFGYARLYMIARDGERWIGVADPRHDGEVRGF